ncbi:amino acid permease [Amycolatopsis cihanbeyliensis]|uniref:APA family basic amino acid/polyamine antiporter n=1 Tax=Amycolatopsis cihanbeyliensis TaxID=1128664 RepID=A0A542DDH3_AMYCI|nr:amino acid permease [Amycolatopsis cihanbeyliensis]TQJ01102.1 APA family basic amino acid/polyamine antiporter [Amycolatopsis cihanbeyliensis]
MGVLRTLNVDDVLAHHRDSRLNRRLRARDLVGAGIGIIIGTGIFTLAGVQAKLHAGPSVTLSFAIGAVVAGLTALCYAELASGMPTAGSAYTYAFATLGEVFAWLVGWDLLLEFALGAAVVSRGWSGYLANLMGLPPDLFGEQATVNLGAVLIIAVLTAVAALGIRQSALVTNVLVLVKVGVCGLILLVGVFFVDPANLSPFVPPAQPAGTGATGLQQPVAQALLGVQQSVYGFAGMLTAAAIVFFAYTGFEALANLGEETRKPSRDLKIGILGALAVCALLYLGVSLVLTGMVPYVNIDESAPLAAAFQSVGMHWIGALISLGVVASLTSVMLVELVTLGRIGFAMGRDGLLPRRLGTVHPRWGTPHRMTFLAGAVIALLAAFVPIAALADLVSIGALAAMIVVAVAVPVLRRRRPDLRRPFRVPFSPAVPILAALACLYLMLNLNLLTWLAFAGWLALGLVIYYGRRTGR